MKVRNCAVLAAASLAAAQLVSTSARGANVLLYTFENVTGTTVPNSGTLGAGANGTLNGTNFSIVSGTPSGKAIKFTNDDATFINTGKAFSALVGAFGTANPTAGEEYTFSAVATLDNVTGDNMIFGQDPAGSENALHVGFRDANVHQGHWGADTTSAGGASIGTRVHVAYRYADTNGDGTFEQQLFLNGVSIAGPSQMNGLDNDMNVLIGTSRNGGGFGGTLDNVRIFDNALTNAEIASLATSDLTFVPEPASAGLLGLAAVGLLARRRRRS